MLSTSDMSYHLISGCLKIIPEPYYMSDLIVPKSGIEQTLIYD